MSFCSTCFRTIQDYPPHNEKVLSCRDCGSDICDDCECKRFDGATICRRCEANRIEKEKTNCELCGKAFVAKQSKFVCFKCKKTICEDCQVSASCIPICRECLGDVPKSEMQNGG